VNQTLHFLEPVGDDEQFARRCRTGPRGRNGGEEATLFCYFYLWLWTAGPGAWSLDSLLWPGGSDRRARRTEGAGLAAWEPYTRSLLRIIVGFLFTLHGCRKLFDVLAPVAGRRNAPALAIDALPSLTGLIDLTGGVLLIAGLFVRQTAVVMAAEALLAYALIAQPRTLWPIRNGGNEALLYVLICAYLAVAGAGAWRVRLSSFVQMKSIYLADDKA